MTFLSLTDPVEIARAHDALDRAWLRFVAKGLVRGNNQEDRARLAAIIEILPFMATNDDDLITLAVEKFLKDEFD